MLGWIETWRRWQGRGELVWVERAWTNLGRQRLPERLLLHTPAEIADWVGEGEGERERWRRAVEGCNRLLSRFPRLAGSLGPHFDCLADADELELGRLAEVLAELSSGTNSALYLRQLPIAGIDSKWIGANRSRITDLPASAVIFGLGYAVDLLEAIPWLGDADCCYWGDLGTHGLAILDRLRGGLPRVRSLLMDEETLLDHRALWSQEGKPVRNLAPALLDDAERLEQERIGWGYAWRRIVGEQPATQSDASS